MDSIRRTGGKEQQSFSITTKGMPEHAFCRFCRVTIFRITYLPYKFGSCLFLAASGIGQRVNCSAEKNCSDNIDDGVLF